MNKNQIGPGVRWIIFAGAPWVFYSLIACNYESLVRAVGEKVAPYLGLGIAAIIAIASLIVYDHIPERLRIPVGIIGWIATLCLGYWFLQHEPRPF